jgi:amidohydrolase
MTEVQIMPTRAEQLSGDLVAWRRDFHRRPELGFEEVHTSQVVAEHLERLGVPVRRGCGKTGVVGLLHGTAAGATAGPTLALRADMDALPGHGPGDRAHLCGHDAHTAMLMGAAQILVENREQLAGTVKFVFQPAEEGLGGAKAMIEDDVLIDPAVDAALGLHVYPFLPTGQISVTRGVSCAAVDWFTIRVVGEGGHAGHPHRSVDAVVVAAQIVTALQTITSRQVDPLEAAVLTIGTINGGVAPGAIAADVELTGTVRTLNPDVRASVKARMTAVCQGIAQSFGARCEIRYDAGPPALVNDDAVLDLVAETAEALLGKDNCRPGVTSMGGEDFACFTEKVPGAMFRLGVGDGTPRTSHPLHHPEFDLDEKALPIGTALLAAAALRYLSRHEDST